MRNRPHRGAERDDHNRKKREEKPLASDVCFGILPRAKQKPKAGVM
jgi:hypothetical protein